MNEKQALRFIAAVNSRTNEYVMDFSAQPEVMDSATSQRVQVLIAAWHQLDPRGRGRVCEDLRIPPSLDMLAAQAAKRNLLHRYRLGQDVSLFKEQLDFFHVEESQNVSQVQKFLLQRAMRIEWEADQLRTRLIQGNLSGIVQGPAVNTQSRARAELFGLEAVNLFIQDRYGDPNILIPLAA